MKDISRIMPEFDPQDQEGRDAASTEWLWSLVKYIQLLEHLSEEEMYLIIGMSAYKDLAGEEILTLGSRVTIETKLENHFGKRTVQNYIRILESQAEITVTR